MLDLSLSVVSNIDLRSICIPHLQRIQSITNETALLAIRTGLEAMFLEQVPSDQDVKYVIVPGRRITLWRGAIGKSMLAFMKKSEIKQVSDLILQSKEKAGASDSKFDPNKLQMELNQIRARGFAISISEQVAGAAAISSPIISSDNFVIGSISIIGSISRINMELAERYGQLLHETAKKIGNMVDSTSISGYNHMS